MGWRYTEGAPALLQQLENLLCVKTELPSCQNLHRLRKQQLILKYKKILI